MNRAMSFNDLIQWIVVGVIVMIALILVARKIIRFRNRVKYGESDSCGCGCAGCTQDCGIKKKNKRENHR